MNIKQAKAEITKQKILEVVYQIVKEEGVHAVSSTKIIKTAGISVGRFFHHFPQVEDLYLYILDIFIEKMETNLAPQKFESFREFVCKCIEYNFNVLEESPEEVIIIFYFFGYSQHNLKYKTKFRNMLKRSFDKWTDEFSSHLNFRLSKYQQDRLLRLLDMYICGLGFNYLILGDKSLYERINEDFIDMITDFFDEEMNIAKLMLETVKIRVY